MRGRVLIVQNCALEGAGLYARYLDAAGVDHTVLHAYRGERFPDPDAYGAFLVCGTPVSAYHVHHHAFLRNEWLFVEAVLQARKPCLGICFGGQLIARLMRARVYPHKSPEIGAGGVELTRPGVDDPLFAGFPRTFPVFLWHADTFDLPDGALHLAAGEGCRNQAFRAGPAVALQFHLEVTASEAARWAEGYADELARAGRTANEVVAECERSEERMAPLAERLMANFLGPAG